jgi:Flagellar protein FliT
VGALPDGLDRFHELAREFRDAAQSGDTGAQERILAERRRLMPRLEALPAPRSEAERQARESTYRTILEIDREAEAILDGQRRSLGQELMTIDSGRRGLLGYGSAGGGTSKCIDERG